MQEVKYYDFRSKTLQTEKVYGQKVIDFFYPKRKGIKSLFGRFLCLMYAYVPFFSMFYGFLQSLSYSRSKVAPFIHSFELDASEFKKDVGDFTSFNDFFTRELKEESRSIDQTELGVAAPCDGRFLCFENISELEGFYVKGQKFNLSSFLKNQELASRYENAPAIFARLCPIDYHRFHFPLSGVPRAPELIKGPLFSVNPVALSKKLSYLWSNKRYLLEIETKKFGRVLMAPIGATNVGSVTFTYDFFQPMTKGDECGYFSFGGSSILLLFENKSLKFDEQLLKHSLKGIETRCLLGDKLAEIKQI